MHVHQACERILKVCGGGGSRDVVWHCKFPGRELGKGEEGFIFSSFWTLDIICAPPQPSFFHYVAPPPPPIVHILCSGAYVQWNLIGGYKAVIGEHIYFESKPDKYTNSILSQKLQKCQFKYSPFHYSLSPLFSVHEPCTTVVNCETDCSTIPLMDCEPCILETEKMCDGGRGDVPPPPRPCLCEERGCVR